MAFPPFPAGTIDGIGIYPKPPEVLDERNRGSLTGKRRDTIIYVCQRAGQFTIPPTRLTWFDLDAQKLRTIDFPARHLNVSSNPALESTAATQGQSVSWTALSWLSAAAVAALIATLCYQYWMPWVSRVLVRWRALHLQPLNPIDPRLSIAPRPAHTSRGRSSPKGRKESADSSSHQ